MIVESGRLPDPVLAHLLGFVRGWNDQEMVAGSSLVCAVALLDAALGRVPVPRSCAMPLSTATAINEAPAHV